MYQNYNPDVIKKSVDSVRHKILSIQWASKAYGIPKSTIYNHLNKKNLLKIPDGQSVLNTSEEIILVGGLLKCSEWGFPMKCRNM